MRVVFLLSAGKVGRIYPLSSKSDYSVSVYGKEHYEQDSTKSHRKPHNEQTIRRFLNDENESVLTVEQLQKFSKAEQEQVKSGAFVILGFLHSSVLRAPKSLPLQPCHRDFCYSLVQPNPDAPIQQWDATKERALLCFRGFGKTTLSPISHCPVHFKFSRHENPTCWSCTLLTLVRKMHAIVDLFNYSPVIEHLFPKFTNAAVKQGAFTTPARTLNIREATITCGSFRSTNASGHYELVSCDDAANDANQGTVTRCREIPR